MNCNFVIVCAAVAVISGSTMTASAHGRDRYDQDRAYGAIQAEREHQRRLIEQGRNDGSLTWYEKYSIGREQARIDQLEREALADGRLEKDEFHSIRRAQDDTARSIQIERRDGQVRGWWWRLWR